MVSHDGSREEKDDTTYKVTVRNVTGHTTVGRDNRVVGGIGAPAGSVSQVTETQLAELRAEFVRVRELVEGLDDAGEREKGAAVDRLEELEAAVTDGEPDVRTMGRVRTWFAEKVPAALGAVTALLLHPTAALLVQAAGEDVAAAFDGLLQNIGPATAPGEG
ncbi:hypothetical protein [Streptomyces wuyuanensis]|uniref:hypothetical protein n=1 Tax=Streptomyces wuyuanensis TaxID=1196353 RepID=UPI003D7462DC